MACQQRVGNQRRIERTQQREFAEQRQHHRHHAVAADARILHDFEDAQLVPATADAIHRIRQAILVEGAGGVDGRCHRQQHGDRLRPEQRGAEVNQRADAADEQADRRKITRRAIQRLGRMPDPARHLQAGEEADGAEEILQLAAQHQAFSETPADSKLAMSLRKASAAATSG